jgi:hypothetical protein
VTGDVYLTVTQFGGTGPATGAQEFPGLGSHAVAIGVVVEPLVAWLWAGGLLVGLGGVLALAPGRRRQPTEPASGARPEGAVVADDEEAPSPEPVLVGEGAGVSPEPVGVRR